MTYRISFAETAPARGPFLRFRDGYLAAMTHPTDDGVWRDEEKLPLSDLRNAMATWDTDGQNDATDNDAGQEPETSGPSSTTPHTGPH